MRGIWTGLLAGVCLGWSSAALADTANVSDDTDTNTAAPSANYGDATTIHVRNTGTVIRNGYVRFDLSAIPPGTQIAHATLRLWIDTVTTPGAINFHPAPILWPNDRSETKAPAARRPA
jgi:hypothetical protein